VVDSDRAARLLAHHIHNSPLAVIEWDKDFRIIRWSPRAREVFGWEESETLGHDWSDLDFVHHDDLERVTEVVTELMEGRRDYVTCNNRNYTRDGATIHCEWHNSVVRDDAGEVASVLSLIQDVTQRQLTQDALRKSEEMRRSIIESSVDHIIMVNPAGRILYINRTADNLKLSEVLGHTVFEFVPEEFRPRIRECFARVCATGQPDRYETEFQPRAGEIMYFEARVAPMMTDGVVESLIINSTDITDRKRSEIRLKRMLNEIHHRVRNNLSSVLALVGLTRSTTDSSEVLAKQLSRRIEAMAFAHDLLVAAEWRGTPLRRIVSGVLQHHELTASDAALAGPPIVIPPELTTALTLCLDELAARATPRNTDEAITVTWVRADGEARIEWRDPGDQRTEEDTAGDLGLRLVRGFVEHDLRGSCRFECLPGGFRAALAIPLEPEAASD
jgi:PAS domain S-box-containing protein